MELWRNKAATGVSERGHQSAAVQRAVALHYEAARRRVPEVVALGRGRITEQISALAKAHGITIKTVRLIIGRTVSHCWNFALTTSPVCLSIKMTRPPPSRFGSVGTALTSQCPSTSATSMA